jgi:uncharacterized protein (TIGR03382 family)
VVVLLACVSLPLLLPLLLLYWLVRPRRRVSPAMPATAARQGQGG